MMSPWSRNWSWPACGTWNEASTVERNVIVPVTAPFACATQSGAEPVGRTHPPTMFAPKPWATSHADTLNWIAVVPSAWGATV